MFIEFVSDGCAVESAVAGVAVRLAVDFDNSRKAVFDEFAVGRGVPPVELPIDNESVCLFGKVKPVAKLSFCIGLASYENVDAGVVEVENFFGVSDTPLPDDPFVRLTDRKLIGYVLNAIEHNLGFKLAPVGFIPMRFEQCVVVVSVTLDRFHEFFHAAEYTFADLPAVLLFAGMRHLDAEFIHFSDELFGRTDAVAQAGPADMGDGVGERARGVAPANSTLGFLAMRNAKTEKSRTRQNQMTI